MLFLLACDPPDPVVTDTDGDGYPDTEDCGPKDASVHPFADEVRGDGTDQDCDGWDPPALTVLSGSEVDEGYGTRLAWGTDLWVGAPFSRGGRAYRGDVANIEGDAGAFCGAGLAALSDGTVLVGCPGAGQVRSAAGIVLEAPGVGGVIASHGADWVASTPTGIIDAAGARTDWDRRPDALAYASDGTLAAGFARGDTSVRVGDTTSPRGAVGDEAGFALLYADLGAGEVLIVGAPGVGQVHIGGDTVGTGSGRFGAALAADTSGTLYVGAPMVDGGAGAVYTVRDGTITLLISGSPGEQLGTSLAFYRDTLAIGAPGAADAAGTVRMVALP